MRHSLLLPCMLLACSFTLSAAPDLPADRPVITPVPSSVAGVREPVIPLQDGWYSLPDPEEDF